MNLKAVNPKISFDFDGSVKLTVTIANECKQDLLSEAEYIMESKELSVDVERSFRHRSPDANAMFWSLVQTLAAALDVKNEEMYHQLLQEYGSFDVVTVPDYTSIEEIAEEKGYRLTLYEGEIETAVRERSRSQYRCYKGTSQYDSKEMGRLIDGALYECKQLDLPNVARKDVDRSLASWKGGRDNG